MEHLVPTGTIILFSGFFLGMFGIRGGTIMVPALVLTTDRTHHLALGTVL